MAKLFTRDGDDYKEVEAFTQDEVDKIVKDRAERVARQQYGDYDVVKEKAGKVDSITADYEAKLKEANTKAETAAKERDEAKLGTEKVKIMHEFKLPAEVDEFVTGSTPEEMRARAEKLSKTVKGGKITIDKTPKDKDQKTSDSKKIAGSLFGKKSDD